MNKNNKNFINTNNSEKKVTKNTTDSNLNNKILKNEKELDTLLLNNPCILKAKNFIHNYKKDIIKTVCMSSLTAVMLFGYIVYSDMLIDTNIHSFYSSKAYIVYINNEKIGVVRDKETIDLLIKDMQKDLKSQYKIDTNIVTNIQITESNAKDSELSTNKEILEKLSSCIDFKFSAFAIKVNGEQIGVTSSKETANIIIDKVKKYFSKDYKPEDILQISIDENIEIVPVSVNYAEIKKEDTLLNYILTGTDEEIPYTVKNGDTCWDIAINHGMTLDELVSANPNINPNALMVGDELSLVVPKPFINVNIKHNTTVEEKIPFEKTTQYVSYMYSDQSSIKQSGKYGTAEVDYVVTEQNGIIIDKEEVSRKVVTNPRTQISLVGTQTPPPTIGVGVFINPVPGAYVSSRFGVWRGTYRHRGLDLAKRQGSSIKAADGGKITYSGWCGTYGYMIEIDHGGGFKTRYGHCCQLNVKVGDKVYQGQIIGLVGSTGYSTGPHCHFEVLKYGKPQNPSSWIGASYK